MKSWEARLQHLSNALAILTGVLFAWSKYFMASSDPYSSAPGPWEPRMHDAHVLGVPLLVYACGVIWRSHVAPQWNARNAATLGTRKRLSGLALLFVLFPMVATGYLVQVAVDETWRKAFVAVHLATSAVWSLSYGLHILVPARRRAARGATRPRARGVRR